MLKQTSSGSTGNAQLIKAGFEQKLNSKNMVIGPIIFGFEIVDFFKNVQKNYPCSYG